jgi:hypothetical protein
MERLTSSSMRKGITPTESILVVHQRQGNCQHRIRSPKAPLQIHFRLLKGREIPSVHLLSRRAPRHLVLPPLQLKEEHLDNHQLSDRSQVYLAEELLRQLLGVRPSLALVLLAARLLWGRSQLLSALRQAGHHQDHQVVLQLPFHHLLGQRIRSRGRSSRNPPMLLAPHRTPRCLPGSKRPQSRHSKIPSDKQPINPQTPSVHLSKTRSVRHQLLLELLHLRQRAPLDSRQPSHLKRV